MSNEQKPGRAADPARTRFRALAFLAAAVVVALGTALLLTRYIERRIAAARVPTQQVVVAKVDLAIATTLRPELLTMVDWPSASLPEGVIRDAKLADGRIVNVSMVKGEPILQSKLVSGEGGKSALANLLAPGMRAMAVRVDEVVAVAGFIHPGDHVDVIVTMTPENGQTPISKIILQNIKVLTVGREIENRARDPQKTMPATVATLMVDSEQAEWLALAASKGQIRLALRSGLDSDVVATAGVAPRLLLTGQLTPEEPKPAVAREAPRHKTRKTVVTRKPSPAPPPQETKVVEILRGDRFEKRDFQKESSK